MNWQSYFGHLGITKYCNGASTFYIFLERKIRESSAAKKSLTSQHRKYLWSTRLEVATMYPVLSFSGNGCLSEGAKSNKDYLYKWSESTCLQKLQDSLLLANLD